MPLNKLTALKIAQARKAGRAQLLSDGGGLYLDISEGGGAAWRFITTRTVEGRRKRTELSLGPLDIVAPTEARERRDLYRRELLAGRDPKLLHQAIRRGAQGGKTFGQCADEYIAANRAAWRNEKHAAQWAMTLKEYAKPLREIPVADVATSDVLRVLQPIWSTKPETASRLRGRIEVVLDAAKARGLRAGDNPAAWKGHLALILPRPAKLNRGHHAAMSIDDLPGFVAALRDASGTAARALEFAILTACRSGEVLGAQWSELRGDAWEIPAQRMKGGRPHRVPLGARAMEILELQKSLAEGSPHVFPGTKRGAHLSNMALAMVLRRLGKGDVTVHGFRSTFKDWASERTHFPNEVSEMALAHAVGNKTEAAYRRGDLFDRRVALMVAWEAFLSSNPTDNVIDIRTRASGEAG